MIRYDLQLFQALNDEYKLKPLVPRPPVYHREALETRSLKRAKGIDAQVSVRGLRVLEIGCGRGEVCRALATHFGCETVGVDIAAYPQWEPAVDGVMLIKVDLSSPKAPDVGQFDLIYSNSVWEHVRHPYSLLNKAFEVLKPGGIFLLTANLYRGPKASHRYREIYFPWPHLLFTDELFVDYYAYMQSQPGYSGPKGNIRASWVNQLSIADYYHYFNLLGFELEKVRFSTTPLDEPFLTRFADKLDRYPRYDLERDFIHATLRKPLENGPAATQSAFATGGKLVRKILNKT